MRTVIAHLTGFPISPQATKLKKEQENLLKQRWELEKLEEERKQMAALRRKAELGCVGSLLPSQTPMGSPQNQRGRGLCGAVVGPVALKPLAPHL